MKKALTQNTTRRIRPRTTLRVRVVSGLALIGLLAGLGLFAARPAHTAGGPIAVNVANTAQTQDGDGRQPVEGQILVSSTDNTAYNKLVYTVPAGKRLIVESMTLTPTGFDSVNGYTALVLNDNSAGTLISFASLAASAGVGATTCVTQPLRLHIEPGGKVLVNVFKSGTSPVEVYISLSGYLVDA